ncbi:MAG: cobalamin biosynthesis protein CobQ [Oscillospiraceae bacterium]
MVFKKVTVLTGDYGCGKTNLAVNLALFLSKCGSVSIVDIDTVNPYFRTADFTEFLQAKGINVVYPQYARTNLDIPVLNFDLESIIANSDYTIIDAGGSEAGAYPIGSYSKMLERFGDNLEMLYVFNMYRMLNRSAEETVEMMREIERASGLKCTALVNNSNLGTDTTRLLVEKSESFAKDVERFCGLPIAFTCVMDSESGDENHLPVKRLVTLPWEQNGVIE